MWTPARNASSFPRFVIRSSFFNDIDDAAFALRGQEPRGEDLALEFAKTGVAMHMLARDIHAWSVTYTSRNFVLFLV